MTVSSASGPQASSLAGEMDALRASVSRTIGDSFAAQAHEISSARQLAEAAERLQPIGATAKQLAAGYTGSIGALASQVPAGLVFSSAKQVANEDWVKRASGLTVDLPRGAADRLFALAEREKSAASQIVEMAARKHLPLKVGRAAEHDIAELPPMRLEVFEPPGRHLREMADRSRKAEQLQLEHLAATQDLLRIAVEERDGARAERDEVKSTNSRQFRIIALLTILGIVCGALALPQLQRLLGGG